MEKDSTQFSKYTNQTKKGPRQHYMKRYRECQRIKVQEHRKANLNYNEESKQRHAASKVKAVEYMGGKCLDCSGVFHPTVYDFHHLDPTEKEISPANALQRKWENAVKELDKCVLLCANCHRLRHYQ